MCERVNVMYAGTLVETGTADQLFAAPRHPYTLGLLQSVPRLDVGRHSRCSRFPGQPRNMLSRPTSCPFAPRCRYRLDMCVEELRALRAHGPVSNAACFNPVAADEWQRTRLGGERRERSVRRPTPLVEIEELRVWFPIKSGIAPRSALG